MVDGKKPKLVRCIRPGCGALFEARADKIVCDGCLKLRVLE